MIHKEKTNNYNNHIFLKGFSTSKICVTLTFLHVLSFKVRSMLYKIRLKSILFGEIYSQESRGFSGSIEEKGSFYVIALRDDKTFLEVEVINQKGSFL